MQRIERKQISPDELRDRLNLFGRLEEFGCTVTQAQQLHLMGLSKAKFFIFEKCVDDLLKSGLLNTEAFSYVYHRKIFHIGKVKSSKAKRSFGIKFERITVAGDNKFYVDKNAHPGADDVGRYGDVNKGYKCKPKTGMNKPDWALKTLHSKFSVRDNSTSLLLENEIDLPTRLKRAKREVRCNRLMQRQAYFFRPNADDVRLALEWQHGVALYAIRDKMCNYPFEYRLRWLICILEDLHKLHHEFIVHMDVHKGNVVIDLDSNRAALIDLGLAHKIGSGSDCFADDLRMLDHEVIACLFRPEYLSTNKLHASAIDRLSCAITNHFAPCSSLQALHYCRLLYDGINNLTDNKIDEISAATLNRKNLTIDDVILDCKRPLKVGGK